MRNLDRRGAARKKIKGMVAGDLVECLICGAMKKSIGNHVFMAHDMTAKEYKIKFNIPLEAGLLGDKTRKQLVDRSTENFDKEKISTRLIEKYGSIQNYIKIKNDEYYPLILKSIREKVSLYSLCKSNLVIDFYSLYGSDSQKEKLNKALLHSTKMLPSTKKKCFICGKSVKKYQSQDRSKKSYCSKECRVKGSINKDEYKCVTCGKSMLQTPSQSERVKTCSKECSSKYQSERSKKLWVKRKLNKKDVKS